MIVPVFIIVYNRVWCLERCFRAVRAMAPRQPVVFINNGSDYGPCLEWLEARRAEGNTVYDRPTIHTHNDLYRSIRESVSRWVAENGAVKAYIVTDPDVELANPTLPWIRTLWSVLKRWPRLDCAGPSLRIKDIPDTYPLKQSVLATERPYWRKSMIRKKPVRFFKAPIDTTFAMYRGSYRKRDVTFGARLAPPFVAAHLDWYLNPAALSPDQRHYLNAKKGLTHYGGQSLQHAMRKAAQDQDTEPSSSAPSSSLSSLE